MDIEKICRTCLALSGPLLSIYDGGTYGDTIASMLRDFTKMKPSTSDNMPQKVCLHCISEINRCYSFKMKCENSNRTLRQLLPDAKEEEDEAGEKTDSSNKDSNILRVTRSQQTDTTPERIFETRTVHVQTTSTTTITTADNQTVGASADNLLLKERSPKIQPIAPAKTHKRHALIDNSKQSLKRKITESYNIDCDEDGYEFILKVDNNRGGTIMEMEMESTKSITDENADADVVVKAMPNKCSAYEIQDGHFDCEEYEIEAVVADEADEDQTTVHSDDVVFVKAETIRFDDAASSPKKFLIMKGAALDETQSGIENQSKVVSGSGKRDYGCIDCSMSFYSLKVLRRHMCKLHGLNIDKVALSDIKYRILERNKTDMTSESQKISTARSPDESEETNNKEEEEENIVSYTENDPSNSSMLKFDCPNCKSKFSSLRALTYHTKKNICNAQSYECAQCERVFASAENLESHASSHKTAAIECPECNKSFVTTEELGNHQIDVHKRSPRNQCNICKKVFTMLSTLRDHLRTHSGEKPFECTICGKKFTQNANLRQHLQRHEKDKKFKCDECPNSYVTKAELFSHKRSHNGDHPFKCEECSATFTTSSSLVKHRRRHTGERPYGCDICPMRFSVLNVLKNHRRLHTGEKPYKCQHCDKRFTQRGDCVIHASKHTANKDIFCATCGQRFPHIALLRYHSKRCRPKLQNDNRSFENS